MLLKSVFVNRLIALVLNMDLSHNNDRLVPERRNSIALAMELPLSCTNPSIHGFVLSHDFTLNFSNQTHTQRYISPCWFYIYLVQSTIMISIHNMDTYFCKMISNVVSQLPSQSSAGSLVSRSVVVSNQRDLEECASGIIRVRDSQWIPPLIYSQIEAQSHTHESPGDYFLTAPQQWDGNVMILMKFPSLAALEVVIWQLPVQSLMKISSKCDFHCSASSKANFKIWV